MARLAQSCQPQKPAGRSSIGQSGFAGNLGHHLANGARTQLRNARHRAVDRRQLLSPLFDLRPQSLPSKTRTGDASLEMRMDHAHLGNTAGVHGDVDWEDRKIYPCEGAKLEPDGALLRVVDDVAQVDGRRLQDRRHMGERELLLARWVVMGGPTAGMRV